MVSHVLYDLKAADLCCGYFFRHIAERMFPLQVLKAADSVMGKNIADG